MHRDKRVCMFSFSPMLYDARIQREAKALRDKGYVVKNIYLEDAAYLSGIDDLESAQASYDKDMEGIETIPVLLWSKRLNKAPKFIFYSLVAIELMFRFSLIVIRNKADYYHSHDLEPAIFAWLGKVIYGGIMVYDAHENEIYKRGESLLKFYSIYERFIMKRAGLAITVNEDIQQTMQNNYGKPVLEVANRPVFIPFNEIDTGRLRKEIALSENDRVIMYVGYVAPWIRGVEVVLEAMNELEDNVIMLIMGVGRLDDFKNHLSQFISDKQIEHITNRVRFIGPYPPDEIVHYLHGADVSLLLYQQKVSSNLINNAPNKFYQSIMARTPVLASHNKTFPKYIYDNPYGVIGETVDESSVEEVVTKIKFMMDDDREKSYRENMEQLSADVSWEAEAAKLTEAYARLD